MDCLRKKFKVVERKKFNRCTGRTQEGSDCVYAFLSRNVSCHCRFLTTFGQLLLLYPWLPQCGKVPAIPGLDSGKIVYTKWSWLCSEFIQLGSERQL